MAAVHVTAYPVYNGGARDDDDDDDVIGIDFRAGQATQRHDDCSPRGERTPESRRCVAVTIDVRMGGRVITVWQIHARIEYLIITSNKKRTVQPARDNRDWDTRGKKVVDTAGAHNIRLPFCRSVIRIYPRTTVR